MVRPELLAVARGEAPADLLLTGGRVVNVFTGEITTGNVAIQGNCIAGVGDYASGKETLDLKGAMVAPGFIDAHMHVESTMLPPSEFVKLAVPHGTTGVVLDPHEIANVMGIAGIRYIMEDARGLPMTAMFALSSCVPASHLETSGARLEARDLEPLFEDERVVALAEVMNYPGVIGGDPGLLEKIRLGLRRHVVDGHCPGLSGKALEAYIAAGISSDHECTTAAEAMEKVSLGMHVHIREGSAAQNLAALLPAVTAETRHRFSFCTDDRHPADLVNEGHIDHVVRKAVKLGLNPITVLTMASINTARHYRRRDLGAVAPGFRANLIVFNELDDIRPRIVFHGGRMVARDGEFLGHSGREGGAGHARPEPPRKPLRLPADLSEASFAVRAKAGASAIRVIGLRPHQIVTESLRMPGPVVNGQYVADLERDILKIAVIERHRGTGNIGLGFVRGFGLRSGALASTVGHDSHNVTVVGTNDRDMLAAVRALDAVGGGQCAVREGDVHAVLPLPIAGLMSDRPAAEVIGQQRALLAGAKMLGSVHDDPFMPLSFLPLPVIPTLKITDLGLVDVEKFEIVPLEV